MGFQCSTSNINTNLNICIFTAKQDTEQPELTSPSQSSPTPSDRALEKKATSPAHSAPTPGENVAPTSKGAPSTGGNSPYGKGGKVLMRVSGTGDEGSGPYQCKECKRSFTRSSSVKRHMKEVHENETSVVCPRCNKVFARPDSMSRHQQTSQCLETADQDPPTSSQ